MYEAKDQVGLAIGELTNAVWTLSAMASVLSRGFGAPLSVDDPAAQVLAAYGLLEATEAGLAPAPAFAEALRGFRAGRSLTASAAPSARRRPPPSGRGHRGDWGAFTDEILVAQGRASAMGGRGFAHLRHARPRRAGRTFRQRPWRAPRCRRRGGRTGLRVFPGSTEAERVDIDPLPRAIELAAATLARHGLAERIELRCPGVQALRGRPGVRPGLAPAALHTGRCRPRGPAARVAGPATKMGGCCCPVPPSSQEPKMRSPAGRCI